MRGADETRQSGEGVVARSAQTQPKPRPKPVSRQNSAPRKQHHLRSAKRPIAPDGPEVRAAKNIQPTSLAGGCAVAKNQGCCSKRIALLSRASWATTARHASKPCRRTVAGSSLLANYAFPENGFHPPHEDQQAGSRIHAGAKSHASLCQNTSRPQQTATNFTLTLFPSLSMGSGKPCARVVVCSVHVAQPVDAEPRRPSRPSAGSAPLRQRIRNRLFA